MHAVSRLPDVLASWGFRYGLLDLELPSRGSELLLMPF